MRRFHATPSPSAIMCACLLLLVGCVAENQSNARLDREKLTREGIATLLEDSGGEYIAGIQEVVDDGSCYGPQNGSSCPLTVRMVEFIAGEPGRPPERCQGWIYSTMEMRMEKPWPNRKVGRKRLVLAYPTKTPGLYGNGLFIVDPSDKDVEQLRGILEELRGRA